MTSRAWFCPALPRGKTLPRRPASAGGNVHDSPASMQKMHPKMKTWDSPARALLFPAPAAAAAEPPQTPPSRVGLS